MHILVGLEGRRGLLSLFLNSCISNYMEMNMQSINLKLVFPAIGIEREAKGF